MIIHPDLKVQNEESSVYYSKGKYSTEIFGELSIFKWTVFFIKIKVNFTNGQRIYEVN